MVQNGNGRKLATHDEQIKSLFKANQEINLNIEKVNSRFNEEIGEIRDMIKGVGQDEGMVGKLNYVYEKQKNSEKRTAMIVGSLMTIGFALFQYILPWLFR